MIFAEKCPNFTHTVFERQFTVGTLVEALSGHCETSRMFVDSSTDGGDTVRSVGDVPACPHTQPVKPQTATAAKNLKN